MDSDPNGGAAAAMPARTTSVPLVAAAVALMAMAVALAEGAMRYDRASDGQTLDLVGSRALRDPVSTWTRMFRQLHPGTRVRSSMYGTGLAAGALATQRADLAPITRLLTADERGLSSRGSEPAPVAVSGGRGRGGRLFLYLARDASGRARPEALAFARVALSDEGQARLAATGAQPLAAAERRASATMLTELSGGATPMDR